MVQESISVPLVVVASVQERKTSGSIFRPCAGCGKRFRAKASRVKKGEGKYCSLSCSGRAGMKKRMCENE